MQSKTENKSRWKRISLIALSLFIVWHAIGISIVGPAPDSYMRQGLMKIYGPYLQILHLNRSWPFYAPNPFLGSILEYETVSTAGDKNTYPLTSARKKYQHSYFRFTNFYAYMFWDPEYTKKKGYDASLAKHLCARHANSDVLEINFILRSQKRFTYQDYRNNKSPLDDEFLKTKMFGPYKCN